MTCIPLLLFQKKKKKHSPPPCDSAITGASPIAVVGMCAVAVMVEYRALEIAQAAKPATALTPTHVRIRTDALP
jgi:hypothetical protein